MSNRSMSETASFRSITIIKYIDVYFRIIACLIAAHIVVAYGETLSIFEMLLMPYYYYALVPSFLIAYILFTIIRAINIRLDKKFDWTEQTIQRAGTQLFFAVAVPAFCAFLLASVYFAIRGLNIFETTYLKYDFQFIVLQLLLINVYYIAYHFYARWSQAQKIISGLAINASGPTAADKQTFQVTKGAESLVLAIDDIAYFYRRDNNNFLRTISGEDFFVNDPLDDIQEQLPEAKFFRINRQLIVHRQSCKGFSLMTYGKLEANIEPFFNDAVVSQKRAGLFKKWLES